MGTGAVSKEKENGTAVLENGGKGSDVTKKNIFGT